MISCAELFRSALTKNEDIGAGELCVVDLDKNQGYCYWPKELRYVDWGDIDYTCEEVCGSDHTFWYVDTGLRIYWNRL